MSQPRWKMERKVIARPVRTPEHGTRPGVLVARNGAKVTVKRDK